MIPLNKTNKACLCDGRHRDARTNQRMIYGLAMVLFSMFKFSVNLLLGVAPEPMNASITFFLGCVGAYLIVSGQLSKQNNVR